MNPEEARGEDDEKTMQKKHGWKSSDFTGITGLVLLCLSGRFISHLHPAFSRRDSFAATLTERGKSYESCRMEKPKIFERIFKDAVWY